MLRYLISSVSLSIMQCSIGKANKEKSLRKQINETQYANEAARFRNVLCGNSTDGEEKCAFIGPTS